MKQSPRPSRSVTRRQALHTAIATATAALAAPQHAYTDVPQPDRPRSNTLPKRITGIEAILLEKPLKERFWMSISPIGGMEPHARRIVLKIHTDSGVTGYGEGRATGAKLFREGVHELLVGRDPFMVGEIWERLFSITYSREGVRRGWSRDAVISAMAAIDIGLYDLMAKSVGLPLYKYLGGYRHQVPVYVTGGYYREGKGIKELVEEVMGYVEKGYNAIKLKVGGVTGGYSIEDDYERVKAVREAVGPKVRLMLDANNGWSVDEAIKASNMFYELDITWLEEPLHWYDDVDALIRVKQNTRIPLASGEHEITRWGARRLMLTGAIDFMQFDCHAHGGITEWRKIAGMASAMHIKVAPHHEPFIHGYLLASVPNGFILEAFANPDRDPFSFEIYSQTPKIENSILHLDDTPGIGVEFDEKAIKKYGTRLV